MSGDNYCEGCPHLKPGADLNDPYAEVCAYDDIWEGLCWKEVRDGKAEIWRDDFGNLMAFPTDNPRLII